MKSLSTINLILFLAFFSCQNQAVKEEKVTEVKDTAVAAPIEKPASVRPVHWSYSEDGGPAGWSGLSPVYAACGNGKTQSPINLLTNSEKGKTEWKMEYKTTSLKIAHNEHVEELINNGHTIQITPQEGSFINYNNKIYHLKQFHFHTPSEHTLNGKNFPMEIHFVHQSDDNSLAVIGVLIKEGKHNKNFDQLIKHLPNKVGEKMTHDSVNIDISLHVPKELLAYHYIGSLTTPPCTENVQWLVLQKHGEMSKEQINAFASRLNKNNRPVQQLYDRKLTIDDISAK